MDFPPRGEELLIISIIGSGKKNFNVNNRSEPYKRIKIKKNGPNHLKLLKRPIFRGVSFDPTFSTLAAGVFFLWTLDPDWKGLFRDRKNMMIM